MLGNSIADAKPGNGRAGVIVLALQELVRVLDGELEQYRDLLGLLCAQREHFAAGDIKSFEENGKQQETAVLKIKILEEARKSIVSNLARYAGIPHEGVTLKKLAALVDSPNSERYISYQREIISLVRELESLKESNAYLIQHALRYVSGVLSIFASAHATDPEYSSSGHLEQKAEKGKCVSGWV